MPKHLYVKAQVREYECLLFPDEERRSLRNGGQSANHKNRRHDQEGGFRQSAAGLVNAGIPTLCKKTLSC